MRKNSEESRLYAEKNTPCPMSQPVARFLSNWTAQIESHIPIPYSSDSNSQICIKRSYNTRTVGKALNGIDRNLAYPLQFNTGQAAPYMYANSGLGAMSTEYVDI